MYTYIAQHYDKLDRDLNIKDKKIGITENLSSRELALNATKSPIGVYISRAWKTGEDTQKAEKGLHAILDNANTVGEWFEDDDDTLESRVESYMSIYGYEEVKINELKEEAAKTTDSTNETNLINELYDKEELKNHAYLLDGETFYNSRFGISSDVTVEVQSDGNVMYRSGIDKKLYDSGNAAWRNPLLKLNDSRLVGKPLTINWFDTPKNKNGESPYQMIARKMKTTS